MRTRDLQQVVNTLLSLALLTAVITGVSGAQQADPAVPALVNFSGVLTGGNGKPLTSITGVLLLHFPSPAAKPTSLFDRYCQENLFV
jgi:hypothetical protein